MINHLKRFQALVTYEKSLLDSGIELVAGVDEVGRGPLAGPVVVAAVILNLKKTLEELDVLSRIAQGGKSTNNDVSSLFYHNIYDSKKVSENVRQRLSNAIKSESISYSIVEASNIEIDQQGIGEITKQLFYKSVKALDVTPDHILTDCFPIIGISKTQQTNIDQGDAKSITIGAASIIAKVYRDELMQQHHIQYPNYGFDQNKGYGTKEHIRQLYNHGISPLHRKSFEPVKSIWLGARK